MYGAQPAEINVLVSRCTEWTPSHTEWTLRDCVRVLSENFDKGILDVEVQEQLKSLADAFLPLCHTLVSSSAVYFDGAVLQFHSRLRIVGGTPCAVIVLLNGVMRYSVTVPSDD